MKKAVLLVLVLNVMIPAYAFAQQGGAFVGSMGLGLTSAQGDFSNSQFFAAGSGFGFEGELRYYLFDGFAFGAIGDYMRFGSSYVSNTGRVSYNFTQVGGLARLNLFQISDGTLSILGGGGIFTPNVHYYVPDNSIDKAADKSGTFFFGGVGLSSEVSQKVIYELEMKYNVGRADYTLQNGNTSNVWDFFYVGVKLSFASKGNDAPPRY